MTDVADALAISDAPDLEDDEQRERWKVRSDRAASWALRKLAEANAEIARITQAAADEIDALKAWRDAALAEPLRDINFFQGVLIEYRMELEAKNPDLPKTYKVPGGVIARRKTPDKTEITDPDKFVRWAIRSGLFDLLKIEPMVSKLKDFAVPTHEVGVCDICEASIVKNDADQWEHDPHDADAVLDHRATPYIDPQGVMIVGEGLEMEIVPGVVHLIREDTYDAKPD